MVSKKREKWAKEIITTDKLSILSYSIATVINLSVATPAHFETCSKELWLYFGVGDIDSVTFLEVSRITLTH